MPADFAPIFRLPKWDVVNSRIYSAADIGPVWSWGIKLGGIDQLWKDDRGGNATVCVLDTGCDAAHPDFAGAILEQQDFTNSLYGADDRAGHGSHTAGTIASRDNGQGIVGIAPDCKLLIGKVLGDDGSGSSDQVVAGLRWALAKKPDIISMSLGSPGPSQDIHDAIAACVQAGIYMVVAAGNAGPNPNTVGYPAAWEDLSLAVGAIDQQGAVASFSSRGPQVDVLAPGENILSCWPGGKYAYLSGTSMATPFVAGVVALMVSYRKSKSIPLPVGQAALEKLVTETATKLVGQVGPNADDGYGLINAKGLFVSVPPPATPPVPPKGFDPPGLGDEFEYYLGQFGGYKVTIHGKKAA